MLLKLVNHHHIDVRAVGRQVFAQVVAAFDDIDAPADQRGSVAQLIFQIGAVVHQDDLVVVQVGAGAQHARQKHHGQRLARTLRMPDHAAALHGRGAGAQPLGNLVRRTKLLVAANHLDARPAVGIHEDGAGAQDLQQIAAGQHARNQLLLGVLPFAPGVVLRMQCLPGVEVFLARGDGAVIGLGAGTANEQQAAVEQARLAFLQAGQL